MSWTVPLYDFPYDFPHDFDHEPAELAGLITEKLERLVQGNSEVSKVLGWEWKRLDEVTIGFDLIIKLTDTRIGALYIRRISPGRSHIQADIIPLPPPDIHIIYTIEKTRAIEDEQNTDVFPQETETSPSQREVLSGFVSLIERELLSGPRRYLFALAFLLSSRLSALVNVRRKHVPQSGEEVDLKTVLQGYWERRREKQDGEFRGLGESQEQMEAALEGFGWSRSYFPAGMLAPPVVTPSATPDEVVNWLLDYLRYDNFPINVGQAAAAAAKGAVAAGITLPHDNLPVNSGQIATLRIHSVERYDEQQPHSVGLLMASQLQVHEGGVCVQEMRHDVGILLQLTPLGSGRCRLRAFCLISGMLPFFMSLLRAMADSWPETANQLPAWATARSAGPTRTPTGFEPAAKPLALTEDGRAEQSSESHDGCKRNEAVSSGGMVPKQMSRRGRRKGTDQWGGSSERFLADVIKAIGNLQKQQKAVTRDSTAEEMRKSLPPTISAGRADAETGMDGAYLVQVAKRYGYSGWEDVLAAALARLTSN